MRQHGACLRSPSYGFPYQGIAYSYRPIAKAWDKKLDGACISIGSVWYSTSVMAIVTDLAIIFLPINQIRRLKLPRAQGVGLIIAFSLGIL